MPRPAYIFLKNILLLSCIMLVCSLALYVTTTLRTRDYNRMKLALYLLESPAGILLSGAVGFAIILDMS